MLEVSAVIIILICNFVTITDTARGRGVEAAAHNHLHETGGDAERTPRQAATAESSLARGSYGYRTAQAMTHMCAPIHVGTRKPEQDP